MTMIGPMHGYRGDDDLPPAPRPQGPIVAISREAGARGGSIARRVARQRNWTLYNQDSLDFLVRDEVARRDLLHTLPIGTQPWADAQIDRLTQEHKLSPGSETTEMIRLILAIAARGEAVIVGRAAGFVLPAA
ncbi:MAG: cytidylate kinase family protein, partial [Gemmataceae bacterium]